MKRNIKYIAVAFLISGFVSAQKIDLNQMPKAGPTPTINIAQPKSFKLKNGLTVMVVENNKLPRVNVSLSMDRPPFYEGNIAGVSEIMAGQLGEGTTKMNKEAFNKRVDFLGANLSFSSGGAYLNTLSKYFPEMLGMMSDAIKNPIFSEEEIQKSKDRMIEGLKTEEKSADAIASRVSRALTYGKNTERGEFETEESIKAITVADVKNNYSKYYAPDNAYLVVVGDVKFNDVKNLIEKNFSDWKKANTKYDALKPANNVAATEINIVDVPNAVQSVIDIGNLHDVKTNNPQFFAAKLANFILGGGGEARLFMNLREKNGFTYGAYSSLSTGKYNSDFSAGASVRNQVTDKAVVEFMNELKAINTVKPEELANAKAKLKGDFIRSLEKPETIATFAVSKETNALPDNFYTNYLKSIDAVTLADVTKAVNATIFPNKERIFVAGKVSEIAEGLEKLGYPVKYFDSKANPVAKPEAKKMDASATVASITDKYIAAIGGKAALEKINSYTTNGNMSMQGQSIDVKTILAKGGKEATLVTVGGMTVNKEVFDGQKGYAEQMGQKEEMTAEQIAEKKKNTQVFKELGFNNADYKVAGIEKINGEDSYAIKGGNTTYYYSVKTGLKTGETNKISSPQGEFEIPQTFGDYKEVNGIKLPHTITVNQMGMEMVMKVTSYEFNKATDADFK